MREALRLVVLEELPHGIDIPHWSFRVMTPASSIASGIDILEAASRSVLFAVNTPLYALYGQSNREHCGAPTDASLAPECFVQREHRIPLTLEMRVPMDGEIFK